MKVIHLVGWWCFDDQNAMKYVPDLSGLYLG
jgi:hypothetical protein